MLSLLLLLKALSVSLSFSLSLWVTVSACLHLSVFLFVCVPGFSMFRFPLFCLCLFFMSGSVCAVCCSLCSCLFSLYYFFTLCVSLHVSPVCLFVCLYLRFHLCLCLSLSQLFLAFYLSLTIYLPFSPSLSLSLLLFVTSLSASFHHLPLCRSLSPSCHFPILSYPPCNLFSLSSITSAFFYLSSFPSAQLHYFLHILVTSISFIFFIVHHHHHHHNCILPPLHLLFFPCVAFFRCSFVSPCSLSV